MAKEEKVNMLSRWGELVESLKSIVCSNSLETLLIIEIRYELMTLSNVVNLDHDVSTTFSFIFTLVLSYLVLSHLLFAYILSFPLLSSPLLAGMSYWKQLRGMFFRFMRR